MLAAHNRNCSLPLAAALPTPPYIPLPVPQKTSNNNGPSPLAKLAASATLTLLPYHRTHISPSTFAKTIHRYLALVRLPPVITHLSLFYLYRIVKSSFPVHEYTVQQLFVTAYALADIYLDDNAYSNKSWLQVLNDGTQMREWSAMEMRILGEALEYKLEVGDKEWARWCEWISEWWQRVGEKEWIKIETGGEVKPPAVVTPAVVHMAQPVPTHLGRTMSVDGMIGWSANVKKRMSQMAEYEWDKETDADVACSDYEDEFEEEEWVESDDEYETVEVAAPTSAPTVKPILRKKDSGYCGVEPSPSAPVKRGRVDANDTPLSNEVKEIQVEATAATRFTVKRATMSFRWKWSVFN